MARRRFRDAPLLNIEGNARTVEAVAKAVLAILSAPHADEATKQTAIRAVEAAGNAPVTTNISSCSFSSE